LIQAATDLIANVHGLREAIGAVVKSIHLLVAEPEYDISYSSPAIPFSIFVSVPRADERNAVVRLAEAIIHEAMHLQLTLIEAIVPLISGSPTTAFSPWKHEDRPIQGVLHGLYVFGVIFQALGSLGQSVPAVEPYSAVRQRQILTEVDSVEDVREGLTSHGAQLWKLLKVKVSTETKQAHTADRVSAGTWPD
jgi:HEXXH motif-containing protein